MSADPREAAISALYGAVKRLEEVNARLEEEIRASRALPAALRRKLRALADCATGSGATHDERLLAASLLAALVRSRIPDPGPVSVLNVEAKAGGQRV